MTFMHDEPFRALRELDRVAGRMLSGSRVPLSAPMDVAIGELNSRNKAALLENAAALHALISGRARGAASTSGTSGGGTSVASAVIYEVSGGSWSRQPRRRSSASWLPSVIQTMRACGA